jgi:hypothetical protein
MLSSAIHVLVGWQLVITADKFGSQEPNAINLSNILIIIS